MKTKIWIVIFACCVLCPSAFAQNRIYGVVKDAKGNALVGVTVFLDNTTKSPIQGCATDNNGAYSIPNIKQGNYRLSASYIGFKTETRNVKVISNSNIRIDFSLEEDVQMLEQVTVSAVGDRKEVQEIKMMGTPVAVIDGKSLSGRGTTLSEVINHQTGVKLRQTGGVGTSYSVNVRGLEGNRVQIYMDGSPLNTPDGSFSLNDIPIQFIDRIEIYKGIVPPELGGDGLGSAINVVTIDPEEGFMDFSYQYQSYGVHNAAATWKHYYESIRTAVTLYVNGESAKNDYTINSPFVEGLQIKRDHDQLKMFDYAVGLDYKSRYFDESSVELIGYFNSKQIQGIQQNIQLMETTGSIYGANPKLEKNDFIFNNLDMKYTGRLLSGHSELHDTSSYIYDFAGNKILSTYGGEVGSLPNLTDDDYIDYSHVTNLKYHILPDKMSINLNNTLRFYTLNSIDEAAYKVMNRDYGKLRSNIFNSTTALTMDNRWLNDKLSTLLTGRLYNYKFYGDVVDLAFASAPDAYHTDKTGTFYGGSLIMKYDFYHNWMLKAAIEHNYRLPKYTEALGDRIFVTANTSIMPEQANNYNLGIMYDGYYSSDSRLQLDANAYVIDVRDMMYMVATMAYFSYKNLGQALLYGADAEVKWDINKHWYTSVNATCQRSLDKTKYVFGTQTESPTYNMQLPHIPIFFLNWSADYRTEKLFGGANNYMRIYYDGSYTDQYYYGFELSHNQSYKIPSTLIHSLGIEYGIMNRKVLFSAECHNLFDANEMTNFNYPLAGRTLSLKVRFTTLNW